MGYFQMTRNVEEIFGGVVVAPHQIPFKYTSTNGGETFLSLPFYPITGFVTINGGVQVPLDNFEIDGNTLNLGRELEPGDVVFCLFDKIMSPQDASNNAVRIYKFLSVGGETEFTPDFTAYGVQSLFIDGRYKVPGEDYNYFKTSNKVVLDNALATGVWVVAEMNIKQNIPALAGNDGASQIGTSAGATVEERLATLDSEVDPTLRQNLGSSEDGLGDALLGVKQPFSGSVLRTQHDKNAEFVSLDDAGGDRNSFDPETLELLVKAVANQLRIPYLGAQQFALPGQTLKAWRYMDGFKDRGAVASFMSVDSPDSSEPTTQVLGLSDASALGKYADRDTVVLFAQAEGQPPLLATSNTTFTATTVTSPDFATVADKLRRKQIIDVIDANTPSKIYSGWVMAYDANTNTITIDTAWYLKGGNGITTGTPSSGSSLKLVPNTKIWGQNTNVILKPTSDATSFAGFELGLYNNKIDGYVGYGYDAYSGGTYSALNGFQARGKLYCGFRNYAQGEYGFIGGGNQYGYYDSGSVRGLFAWNNTYGVNIKSPTSYAIILQDSSNGFISGMDNSGRWQSLKLYSLVTSIGSSISSFATTSISSPSSSSDAISLPSHSAGKVVIVRNISSSYSLSVTGSFDTGASSIRVGPRSSVILQSDGSTWGELARADGKLTTTGTWNPPSIATGTQQSTVISVPGVAMGDVVSCSFSLPLQGTRMWAEVTGDGSVTVYHRNDTGATVDIASGTIRVIKLN